MDSVLVVSILISIAIFVLVLELVRRNRLKEKYSLLWLFSAAALLVFSVSREFLHRLAALIGISYPPSLIFLFGLVFLIVINIHFSTVVSQLYNRNKELAQELALLRLSLEKEQAAVGPFRRMQGDAGDASGRS